MILIGHIETHNPKSRCGNLSNTYMKPPKFSVPWSFLRFHVCNLTMVWVRPTKLLLARLIAIFFLMKIYLMFPSTYITCDYCCVTFMSLFNLRHLRDLTSYTSRRGTLYIYTNMFFWPFGLLSSSGRGSFLVLSAPWHAGSPHASLGLGRGRWHVLWGFKVARPLGERFRARRAIQAPVNPRTG